MSLTVRDALDLDVFQRAQPRVVAGRQSLDRPIRWVHISELADVGRLIKGGELVLTTGMGLRGLASSDLQEYISDLAPVAAGVVVELGRAFSELPADLVASAERHALPLIELNRRMRYVEATEAMLSLIVSSDYDALRKAETASREFSSLLLRQVGLKGLLDYLAQVVKNPVVLEDTAHQLIGFAPGRTRGIDDLLARWDAHSRTGHLSEHVGGINVDDSARRCIWVEIWLRDEPWGRLHVIEQNRPISDGDRLVIDRASTAISMSLLYEKDILNLSDSARGSLLWDIRHAGIDAVEIAARARALGADLDHAQLQVAIVRMTFDRRALDHGVTERERQRIRANLLAHVRVGLRERQRTFVSAVEGDEIVVVAATASGGRDLGQDLADAIESDVALFGSLECVVGLSDAVSLQMLRRAFRQAEEAVLYALRSQVGDRVVHYADLGVDHLLAELSETSSLPTFVEAELGCLLALEVRQRKTLIETLRIYLESGGNKSAAAKRLHIERRTLYHRLGRLQSVLLVDLDDALVRFRLLVALKGLDVLERRSARSVGEGAGASPGYA